MRNVVMARVDERLIHGQVMTSWLKVTDANAVLVIDTASATSPLLKRILVAACPKNMALHILPDEAAAEFLLQESEPGEKLFVLAKTPGPFLCALNHGVALDEIYLGNMGGGAGRKKFNKNIYASPAEVQDMKAIMAKNVPIYCQMVPSDTKENVTKLLK